MRRVRIAPSARDAFQHLLEQGAEKFGIALVMQKERAVYEALDTKIALSPHQGAFDEHLELLTYHVKKTPFVLVYEYDDAEVRVLFIVHERADRRSLDPSSVDW